MWYYAEVPHDTRGWLERPLTAVPMWSGRGPRPTRERLCPEQHDAERVTDIAARLPAGQWQRLLIKEGSAGPMLADFFGLRVIAVRDGLPGPEVWLVLRRQVGSGAVARRGRLREHVASIG